MYFNRPSYSSQHLLCVLCLWALSSLPLVCFAQQQVAESKSDGRKDYIGWSLTELEQLFGPADRSSDSKASEERVVFFGDSMFVLKQGEVSSWSNAGDLDARRKISEIRIKSSQKSTDIFWLSPWESSLPASKDEVLDSFLSLYKKGAENTALEDVVDGGGG